jgi:tetratricopeptide (TPR) repeat protein
MLGAANGMLGRLDEAEQCCRRVVGLVPNAHGPYVNLANVLGMLGRTAEAEACYRRAIGLAPNDVPVHVNLGNLLMARGRLDEAETHYREAIRYDPRSAEALSNLGAVLCELGRAEEAEEACRGAVAIAPDFADAHVNLGNALSLQLNAGEAERCYRLALRYAPDNARVHANLGRALQTLGDYQGAAASYDRALALNPGDPGTVADRAGLYERMGDLDGACRTLTPLIERQTDDVRVGLAFAVVAERSGDHRDAARILERCLSAARRDGDRADVHFALGEVYDEMEDYEQAFRHYEIGNSLDRHPFDEDAQRAMIDGRIAAFSALSLQRLPRAAADFQKPVFIVGMPRSGTSLVEQILASHPDVYGLGEAGDIGAMAAALPERFRMGGGYPEGVGELAQSAVDELALEYIQRMEKVAGDAVRTTDKTPLHFLELGLIQIVLPGARIIHCLRDRRDTCLSIYFHRFNREHGYAADLRSLGIFYRLYERLMRHWGEVLSVPVMDVRYEGLVAEQEAVSRELTGFCGLEWNERCLRFFESGRPVNTPSYDQVRRPIYTKSVARWRHYERFIEPLLEALEG